MYRFCILFLIFLMASCSQSKPSQVELKNTNLNSKAVEQDKNNSTIQYKKTSSSVKNNEDYQFIKREKAEFSKMSNQQNTDNKTINFLILGSDARGEKVSRSDSIIIANYDPTNRQIKLISLMRDSYVEIPNYPKKFNKLNTAYFLGGKELLKETILKNFGISVDHTVSIDFQGFIKIVDTLAPEGVTIDVKQEIIDDRNLKIKPGKNALHGNELLSYVRYRSDGESDFGRVKRQQEVIITLKDTMHKRLMTFEGFTKIPKIVTEISKHMETDISLNNMIVLSTKMLLTRVEKVDTLRIPIQNGYVNERFEHSGAVLKLDLPKNRQAINEFINEPKT